MLLKCSFNTPSFLAQTSLLVVKRTARTNCRLLLWLQRPCTIYCFPFRCFQPLFSGETLKYKLVSLCLRVTSFFTPSRSSGLCPLPGKAENTCITRLRSGALKKLRSTQHLFVQSLNARQKGGFNNCNLEASNKWRRKVKWREHCSLKLRPEYLERLTRNEQQSQRLQHQPENKGNVFVLPGQQLTASWCFGTLEGVWVLNGFWGGARGRNPRWCIFTPFQKINCKTSNFT